MSEADLDLLVGDGAPRRVSGSDTAALADLYAYPERPWVRANMVASLDGAATDGEGRSGGISSSVDKAVFRVLRGLADVVLVGAGTARAEGYGPASPQEWAADARAAAGRPAAAVVAQVTRSGRVETGRGMFDAPGRALVVMPDGDREALDRAREAAGEDAVVLAGHVDHGGTDLAAAVAALAERGLTRVLCEGGPALLGALATADLLDELCLTTSPALVASDASRVMTGDLPEPRPMALAHLLHAESSLLARWVRDRG